MYIYLIYMYKQDLALNNRQLFVRHKNQASPMVTGKRPKQF